MPHSAGGGSAERRPSTRPSTGRVKVDGDGATVTISLSGRLDRATGKALLDTVRTELDRGPSRIDVDLAALAGFSNEGAAALAAVRDLGTSLVDGLHYRTEGGAGGEAVLAAFARDIPIPD
jgi:hypothetical protein